MKSVKNLSREFLTSRKFELVYHGHNLAIKDTCANDYAKDTHLLNIKIMALSSHGNPLLFYLQQ